MSMFNQYAHTSSINTGNDTWSQIKAPLFKHWILDTGKEIHAWDFIQGNMVLKWQLQYIAVRCNTNGSIITVCSNNKL